MSQREQLEKRVSGILDKHLAGMNHGSPDATNLLLGGANVLYSSGAGAINDFLMALARGVPLPYLLTKLVLKKGKGHDCRCKSGICSCDAMPSDMMGGVITDATRTGLKAYQDFIRAKKASGVTHKEALAMWKIHKASAKDLPPPPMELLQDDSRRSDASYAECMKLLGMPPSSDEAMQSSDRKTVEMIKEQIDEGLAEQQEENPEADPRLLGMGRKLKRKYVLRTPAGGKPLSADHRKKLILGQDQYRFFMKTMKDQGCSHKEALQLYHDLKKAKGGSFFDDFAKGFMSVVKPALEIAPHILPFIL